MSKISIAVFGLNGYLGKPVLDAINSSLYQDKIQFPIKAVTRSKKESTDKVQYIQADLAETDKIAKQLEGVDVVIELVGPNPVVFQQVENIVLQLKPKLFIPSQYGCDLDQVERYAPGFLGFKTIHSNNVRKAGIKVVDIATGVFLGDFLLEGLKFIGIDSEAGTYEVRGDLENEISYSSIPDIANIIVGIATYPDISKLPDSFRFETGKISVGELIQSYENKTNKNLTKTREIDPKESLTEFQNSLGQGIDFSQFLSYIHYIISQGLNGGLNFNETDNELINPNESIWKYSKFVNF